MFISKIRGTKEQLRALGESFRLHRRLVRKISETKFEVPAILDYPEVSFLELNGFEVVVEDDVKELLSRRLKPAVEHGQSFNSAEDLFSSVGINDGYMDVDYIENWNRNLPRVFPMLCSSLEAPNKTWEGRTSSAVRVRAGNTGDRPVVLFTSGVHAAELGGPDSCVYFLYRLLDAYARKAEITLGKTSFSAGQVAAIVDNLDIFVFPCVNPDGRAFVQNSKEWWRKNRNPDVGMDAAGVDINRNFDFLWSSGIGSSFIAGDDTYRGTAAFSEPETRNVKWFMDTSGVDYFLDIHGYAGSLEYTWGDALNQTLDPSMSFSNPLWNGKRFSPYKEYLKAEDEAVIARLGARMVGAANAVGKGGYDSGQSFAELYSTTATSDDYAYSRHLADPSLGKTYAFTLEYGGVEYFPPYGTMKQIINEVNAAMLDLCDAMVALATETKVTPPVSGS